MFEPFPHQIEGRDFALKNVSCLLAHEQGCGKTRTAIMAARQSIAKRVLVICPPIALGVWHDEIRRWTGETDPRYIQRIRKGSDKVDRIATWVIVGYALLSRSRDLVAALKVETWDIIVLDEAHNLKERSAKRTRAIYGPRSRGDGIVGSAYRTILLTGTPILNHPAELWTHLRALAPELLGPESGFDQFVERFCKTETRWIGGRSIETIKGMRQGVAPQLRMMLAPFMHRVKKVDVLKDLPPMIWGTWPVALADCAASPDVLAEWKMHETALRKAITGLTDEELLTAAFHAEHMATQRRLTGIIKATAAVAAINDQLEGGTEKVIIFAHHTGVIDMLAVGLKAWGIAVIDGRTPAGVRDDRVRAFQNDPDVRVFIGQNQAASTAITLTAASNVWLLEPDWTPAINAQAAARAHRPGQKDSVTVRTLVLEGSVDAIIGAILARKSADINAIVEGHPWDISSPESSPPTSSDQPQLP